MSEYKSPINVTFDDISNEVINRYDNEIICRVKKITEIDVDKERLINALLLEKNLVHCKDCKYSVDNDYCLFSTADMGEINKMDANDFCSRGERRDESGHKVSL